LDKIAVLDFGGQYAHLIANRVRRLGVFTEILSPESPVASTKDFKGIIFSGGPSSVYAENAPKYNPELIHSNLPKLGICYGHQLICRELGGEVTPGQIKEYGVSNLEVVLKDNPLFRDLPEISPMWMSHGDQVSALPEGFEISAQTSDCPIAAVSNDNKKIYGIQFHPEVTHSQYGSKVLENFLDICSCSRDWSMNNYMELVAQSIQSKVADRKVFLLVSGGVDSTVAFVLLNKILGPERVLGLHIDNGMMRLAESEKVMEFLQKEGLENLHIAHAQEYFLQQLKNISAPEEKREIIGDAFLEIKNREVEKLQLKPEEWLLAQGTIYPDTIESGGTDNADIIKTHHNRVAAVLELMEKGMVLEPLSDLYKDEVRLLGEELGIPRELLWRHPFPGPGLGVRLLCSDGEIPQIAGNEDLDLWCEEKGIHGILLPIRSVGVQGDARTYAHPFLLESKLEWNECEQYSTALTNRFTAINRVVWQVGAVSETRPQLVKQFCTQKELDLLRTFDDIATNFLWEHDLYNDIWQMPVVLLPLQVDEKPVVVLRPVNSSEAMTASFARIGQALLRAELWPALEKAGAGALYYDVTHKPPGTIEWE